MSFEDLSNLALVAFLFGEAEPFGNYAREPYEEHSRELFSNFKFGPGVQKEMPLKEIPILSPGCQLVWWSGNVWAMFGGGFIRTIYVILFCILASGSAVDVVLEIYFSSGSNFVLLQQSVWTIFIEGLIDACKTNKNTKNLYQKTKNKHKPHT